MERSPLVSEPESRLAVVEQQDLLNKLPAEEAEIDTSVIPDSDGSQFRKCLFSRIPDTDKENENPISRGQDRHNKCGSPLSGIEGQILVDIINDHGFDQLVRFPTRERYTLDLIITSLPNQFVDIHSPNCLSDHDIVSGTLKIVVPPIKKHRRKVYRYQKGDYKSMRADTLKIAKEKYFNGYSDTRSGRKIQSYYIFHSGLGR